MSAGRWLAPSAPDIGRTASVSGDVLTVRCTADDETVTCVLNMGTDTALVPNRGTLLLASSTQVRSGHGTVALPADTAVWLLAD